MNAGSQEEAFSPIVGRARARLTTGVVLMTLALIGATLTVGASPAQAKTYKRLATKSVKAYDWAGYKYRIKASGFGRVPSGYINVANSVTVKRNGRTVANNKASYRAKAGTYTVYYKSKIRKKIYAPRILKASSTFYSQICTVGSSIVTNVPSPIDDGFGNISYTGNFDVTYTGYCNGENYDDGLYCDVRGCSYYPDRVGAWGFTILTSWSTSLFFETVSKGSWESSKLEVGQEKLWACLPDEPSFESFCETDGPAKELVLTQEYPSYRYGPVLTRYFKRTVKVVKKNSRIITPSEWKKLRSGLSVGEVSRLFGNPGKVSYVSGNLVSRAYRDLRYDGSYCNTYFLTFKNGKLYSWDNDQFTDRCVS
jgi:hypothetical protein